MENRSNRAHLAKKARRANSSENTCQGDERKSEGVRVALRINEKTRAKGKSSNNLGACERGKRKKIGKVSNQGVGWGKRPDKGKCFSRKKNICGDSEGEP